jgi:hypothetical protein
MLPRGYRWAEISPLLRWRRRTLRTAFPASARTTPTPTTTLSARTRAARTRTIFLRCQLAVAILVQFLQRFTGFGNFRRVDGPVLILVQGFNNRHRPHHGPSLAGPGQSSRTFATGRPLAIPRWIDILRRQQGQGGAQRQQGGHQFCFHLVFRFVHLFLVRLNSIWRSLGGARIASLSSPFSHPFPSDPPPIRSAPHLALTLRGTTLRRR